MKNERLRNIASRLRSPVIHLIRVWGENGRINRWLIILQNDFFFNQEAVVSNTSQFIARYIDVKLQIEIPITYRELGNW